MVGDGWRGKLFVDMCWEGWVMEIVGNLNLKYNNIIYNDLYTYLLFCYDFNIEIVVLIYLFFKCWFKLYLLI